MSLQTFTDAYITCALWSSTDDHGVPMDDNYGPEDIAPDALGDIERDCADFYAQWAAYWTAAGMADEQAGHDFWLTRNGHGAGFWDRGIGNKGRVLTNACKPYGTCDLYVGYDGKLYVP